LLYFVVRVLGRASTTSSATVPRRFFICNSTKGHCSANIIKKMKNKLLLLSFGLLMTTQMIFSQVPSYVPTNGLVGYWPFNGNANDQSGNGNNGTVNGATLTFDRYGNANNAYDFDGNNTHINVPLQQNLQGNKTFSCWIKLPLNFINPYCNFITAKNQSLTLPNDYLSVNGNNPSYISSNTVGYFYDGKTGLSSSFNVNDNLWHNIILTHNYNLQEAKLYIDGIFINSIISTNFSINSLVDRLVFGGDLNSDVSANAALFGQLDDIGIWNRALTQQEITNMYNGVNYSDTCNAVSGSLVNGLVGYWPFCGNANDQSGNGNNGTVNGASLTTDRFGNTNSAYSFNGVNNYIKCLNAGPTGNPSITTSFWLKSSQSTYGHIIGYGNNGVSGNDFRVYINGNGLCNNGSISFDTYDNDKELSTTFNNVWDFYVVIYDGSIGTNTTVAKIYKNGTLLTSVCYSVNISNTNIASLLPITFGRYHGTIQTGYFNGSLDDIGIWNRALTQQEITQLYNQNQCMTNITVMDTLIINVGQLSYTNPVTYANNITIYPNPANTQVNISFNNISDLTGGHINIINSLGQQVATTPITLSGTNTTMPLNTWGGTGLYFVQIVNTQGIVVDVKKIILQ